MNLKYGSRVRVIVPEILCEPHSDKCKMVKELLDRIGHVAEIITRLDGTVILYVFSGEYSFFIKLSNCDYI